METIRLLSRVLHAVAEPAIGIPGNARPAAVARAVEFLEQGGLVRKTPGAPELQLTDGGKRLLHRIGLCQGASGPCDVWHWDGQNFPLERPAQKR